MKCVRIDHKFETEMSISTLETAIAHLKSVVPKEFHDKVHVDFDGYDDYGSVGVELDVYYQREDTPEEIIESKRLRKLAIEVQKKRLRKQLDSLEE